LEEGSSQTEFDLASFAFSYTRFGEKEKGFVWLERGYQGRAHEMA
jgi:hypothetical protein